MPNQRAARADHLSAAGLSDVRPVRQPDVPMIKLIVDDTGLFPSEMLDEMIAPYFDHAESRHIWVGHERGGILAGFAFCMPERMTNGTWNVLAIGVLPALQGAGVGAAIMGYLERSLTTAGERILVVETSGLPEFARTRRFYSKLSYTEEACIRDFYEPGDDKVVFTKRLR